MITTVVIMIIYYSLHSVSPAQSRKRRGVTHRLLQGRRHCLILQKCNLNKTNTFIKQNRYLKLLQQNIFSVYRQRYYCWPKRIVCNEIAGNRIYGKRETAMLTRWRVGQGLRMRT